MAQFHSGASLIGSQIRRTYKWVVVTFPQVLSLIPIESNQYQHEYVNTLFPKFDIHHLKYRNTTFDFLIESPDLITQSYYMDIRHFGEESFMCTKSVFSTIFFFCFVFLTVSFLAVCFHFKCFFLHVGMFFLFVF